jgi:hypothetical protein
METIWNFILDNAGLLSGFILSIGVVGLWAGKLRNLLRQVAELFIAFDEGLADGKLDKNEILKLRNEFSDVWNAIKGFGKKK